MTSHVIKEDIQELNCFWNMTNSFEKNTVKSNHRKIKIGTYFSRGIHFVLALEAIDRKNYRIQRIQHIEGRIQHISETSSRRNTKKFRNF